MPEEFISRPTDYKGHPAVSFTYKGHECTVVPPVNPCAQRRWVWRAEFLGAFDSVDQRLLEMGWHIAYCRVSDMFGCPESIEMLKEFHDFVVKQFDLNPKADIFGFSRGGLYAFHYTLKYPEDICVLYLDAPVQNMFSWPQGKWAGIGSAHDWEMCKDWWHIDEEHPEEFRGNPTDLIEELLATKVPVVMVAGGSDEVVPYDENGQLLEQKMKACGYDCLVIVKPECGHHPHSLEDPTPVSDFIVKHS